MTLPQNGIGIEFTNVLFSDVQLMLSQMVINFIFKRVTA